MQFYKYEGTGNDFIIIDNSKNNITLTSKQIANLCHRKFGIGADGLMLLQQKNGYDFEMIYYNADGGESTMCGNGGRCLTQFAKDIGIKRDKYKFWAIDGEHESYFNDNGWVHLKMIDVKSITKHQNSSILNTGSPHYVVNVVDLQKVDVFEQGKEIRYSKEFALEGVNVNFVQQLQQNKIFVRTYERGVEDETLSCGTGVIASALIHCYKQGYNKLEVKTLGGNLAVEFEKINENNYSNIWLSGNVNFVFKGEIFI